MTDERTLTVLAGALRAAAAQAADDIIARDSDGSFLERTLRDALAARLPNARTEQPLNLDLAVWRGRLGGVDVLYDGDDGTLIGVETKVWDVADSLYDLFKLAAGTQRGTIVAGFCVIAGRTRDWKSPSAISDLSVAPLGKAVDRDAATVLRDDPRGWSRIWSRTAIRPAAVPARIPPSPANRSQCRGRPTTKSASSAFRRSATINSAWTRPEIPHNARAQAPTPSDKRR